MYRALVALCTPRTSKVHLSVAWLRGRESNAKVVSQLRFTYGLQTPGSEVSTSVFLVSFGGQFWGSSPGTLPMGYIAHLVLKGGSRS